MGTVQCTVHIGYFNSVPVIKDLLQLYTNCIMTNIPFQDLALIGVGKKCGQFLVLHQSQIVTAWYCT